MLKQRLLSRYSGLPLHWKISLPFTISFFWLWLLGTSTFGYFLSKRLETQQIKRTKTLAALILKDFEEEQKDLRLAARLLANKDIISQAVDGHDRNTLLQSILPLRAVLNTDVVMVVDPEQQVLLDSRQTALQGVNFQLQSTLSQLLAGADLSTLITADNAQATLLVGTAPIKNAVGIRGGLLLGTAINDQRLNQISEEIDEELIGLQGDTIFASTLPEELEINPQKFQETYQRRVSMGHKHYISQTLTLQGIDEDIRLVLLSDRQPLEQAKIMGWLAMAGIAWVGGAIAMVVGSWVGQTITRPIRQVTQVAQRVTQENNFDLQAPILSQDEVGTLAIALNQLIQWAGQYTDDLERTGQTLEQRVEERTQELAQALKDLKATQTQLIQTEKMSGLGQMVAGIAHEINNPINFIHGNLTYIDEYTRDLLDLIALYQAEGISTPGITDKIEEIDLEFLVSDFEKILHSIQIGTERVKDIIISLRNFSRLDEAMVKPVDLHEGLNSTLLILSHRLKQGVEVVQHYDQLPLIQCSPAQLNQVFINIITNALDAMEEANSQPRKIILKTKILVDKQQVKIQIQDTGPGIPADIQHKIFDPFFTTKPVGKGTGLGLGICFQIIENHQGQIEVISDVGTGTKFTITLNVGRRLPP